MEIVVGVGVFGDGGRVSGWGYKCIDVVGCGVWEAGKMASYLYHLLSLR